MKTDVLSDSIHMTNKYTKKIDQKHVIGTMQIKITVRCYFTHTKMAKTFKRQIITNANNQVEKLKPSLIVDRIIK